VIRWAWRLLRREWRQQLLILALITVAVAATLVGAAVATGTPSPASAGFGTAQDRATFDGSSPHLRARVASLARRFGRTDVIENETVPEPGSVQTFDMRAQNPHGPFGQPLLSLVSGRYPTGPGQVAVTSGLASSFRLAAGDSWRVGGTARRVTGIVVNPHNLLDQFALVAPGQVKSPDQVTVLFDAHGRQPASIGPQVQSVSLAAPANAINPETISIAAATLGMLLIALVGAGGFTVLAQRRLRAIGMLGAQGATDRNIRLVVRANGAATGVAGAVAGFALGLAAWLAYRPRLEASAHHLIGAFQLPWLVIIVAMVLAVPAAYLAAARPARAIARVAVVTALSGRPAPPKPVRRWAAPAGIALLVVAFLLMGVAGSHAGESNGGSNAGMPGLVAAIVALCVAVVLLSPACLAVLARLGRRAPIPVRLALRDLARYRARSGSALGAISLSVLIAAIIIVVSAARFGNVLDYAGPNLAPDQLLVYPAPAGPASGPGSGGAGQPRGGGHNSGGRLVRGQQGGPPAPTASQLRTARSAAGRIAAALGSRDVITLEQASAATLLHAAAGRNWNGPEYGLAVATPQLLRAFGIKASQVDPAADILTMRPGLATMPKLQLLHANGTGPPPRPGENSFPCPASTCLAGPVIQEVRALPSGTSAPNTVITAHAVRQLHLHVSTAAWLIETRGPLTSTQIHDARQAAAAAGLTIEARNSVPSLSQITDVATVFAVLLALGILAMSVGLIRSETASDRRTLAATGASGRARRTVTAATAGALALTGAVLGLAGGYLAAIGFFRTSHLDGLSSLRSIPVAPHWIGINKQPKIPIAFSLFEIRNCKKGCKECLKLDNENISVFK
jgi:putative ABC transport system permease protein